MKNIALFVTVLAFGSGMSSAEPIVVRAPVPSQNVSFADLNLGSPEGVSRLKRRIQSAASNLCLENNVDSLKVRMARSSCYWRATSDGFAQMNRIVAARGTGAQIAAATLTISAR